jgi:hypothetical protein
VKHALTISVASKEKEKEKRKKTRKENVPVVLRLDSIGLYCVCSIHTEPILWSGKWFNISFAIPPSPLLSLTVAPLIHYLDISENLKVE